MRKSKLQTLTLRLEPGLLARFKRAVPRHLTMSAMLRSFIMVWLDTTER